MAKVYGSNPVKTRESGFIILLTFALFVSGCANSLSTSIAGIYNIKESKEISVSEKPAVILAVDDALRQFSILEKSETGDLVFRIIDYDGKEIERKATKSRLGFTWECQPSLSPDGRRIAFYSITNGHIGIYDLESSTEKVVLTSKKPYDISILEGGIKWASNSEIIIMGTIESMNDAHIVKYDVDKESVVKVIKFESCPNYFIWPGKKYVGLATMDNHMNQEIKIFDPVKMEIIKTIKPDIPHASITNLCTSPSGKRIAYSEYLSLSAEQHIYEKSVKVYDLNNGEWNKFRRDNVSTLGFLDDDTLVYTYYTWNNPFITSVRKIDLKYGFAKTLFRPNEPPARLFGADGGKILLFSLGR